MCEVEKGHRGKEKEKSDLSERDTGYSHVKN